MSAVNVRLDKYLWAIRIFKTRSQTAEAIDKGKVKHNGVAVKPSKTVKIGDCYEIKAEHKNWEIEVLELLEQRKQFSEACLFYSDLSPKEIPAKQQITFVENTGKRQSKQGRPTKKNRRLLDDLEY